jgi:hypothetical protein
MRQKHACLLRPLFQLIASHYASDRNGLIVARQTGRDTPEQILAASLVTVLINYVERR